MSASAPSAGDAGSSVLIKASMPREHGSGFITIKIDSDATTIGGLKRQLLEKVRTKRVSISLAPGQALESPSAPPPALTQAALDEYGITLFDEAAAAAEAAATASPAFLSDDRPLRDLRRTFAGCTIWKLSLVAKPKKDIGVTEGYLKKRSSSKRLFGAWQKRFFRLTTRQLAYWTTEAAAQMVPVGGGGLGAEMRPAEPPKGAFRVSAFHEAVTVAKSATGPSSPPSVPSLPATQPPPPPQQPPIPGRAPLAPRGRVARQASVLNVNLDSTRVRLGPWGSFIFILEFPLRSLELQASNKADFQRWLNALFGSAWVSNLVVQHAADEGKAPQPSLPLGAAPASAGSGPAYGSLRTHQQQQQNGSSYPAAASPAPLHGSIPIESRIGFDPSRIGGGGTDEPVYDNHARAGRVKDDDGEDSREVSLSARDLLRRAVGVSAFGFGSAAGPSTGAGAGAGVAPPNDDDEGYDSQDSMSRMSQAWEDTQDEWALDAIVAGAGAGAGRGQQSDALGGLGGGYEEFDPRPSGDGGEDRLNSFMPSASATPESSQARPVISDSDDDDDDDHGRKPGQQQQHVRGGGGGGGIPVEEDSDHGLDLSSASGSDSDSDSDDEMRGVQLRAPPPPPMPAALAAASSAAAAAAAAPGAPPLPLSPYPGAASPAAAASPASPSGLFAGGLGAGASGGGVAFHGALLGGAHGRRESFSGGLGLAGGAGAGAVGAVGSSASRRPSVDLSASIASLMGPPPPPPMPASAASPSGSGSGSTAASTSVQPPPGSELNLSPTLRRMSLGGGGQQPPLPAGPPPSSSPSSSDAAEAEARLKRQADVRAALAAVEAEEKASEAAAEERAAEERRKKEEAQAANLRNIRAYLEAEQAAEAAAKAKAAATASAAPAPPPFPGSLSTPSPAPSPPLPPSSGPADIEQEVAQLRSTLALRSHADVVEVAAAQAREIAGLKAQIAAMKMMQ